MIDKKILWRAVHAGFLVCIGMFGAGSFLGISSVKFLHVLLAFAVLFLLTAFWSMSLRGRWLFFAGMLVVLFGVGIVAGGKNVRLFWQSYVYWLIGRPLQGLEWRTGYELVQTAFLALLSFLLQMIMEKNFHFRILEIMAVFSLLTYSLFAGKELSRISVALMFCYVATLCAEGTQIHWKKEKQKGIQAYMLWIMPFLALYFVLMLLPKIPKEPYDWQFVRSVYSQVKESFLKFSFPYLWQDDEDYDLSLSGFSESGRLEGKNGENRREIMTVESKAGPVSHIYLIGKVYDTFDGRQWEGKNENSAKERYFDMAETLCAVKKYDDRYYTDYLTNREITIRYKYFRSEFLFAPLKMSEVEQDNEKLNFKEFGGSLYFDGKNGYGTEYGLSFYQLNAGQDAFWAFLEEASVPGEDNLEEILAALGRMDGENTGVSDVQRYRQEIFDYYRENVTLSDDVEAYLRKITEGAETDVEKLRAIEAELSSFTYTRTPGELPESVNSGEEFLDYFLLESREGYCTYFATAFVLLARAEGLPARYVQGFCVPVSNREETFVYSDMAHAWPEVYFEGVGWIPFEPTPGYLEMRYTSWGLQKGKADSGSQTAQSGEIEEFFEETEEENGQELLMISEKQSRRKQLLRIFGLVVMWIFAAVLLVFLLNRLFVRLRYRKMDEAAKFKAEAERNLRILAIMGVKRKEEETLEEFRVRAKTALGGENALEFLQSYEDFLYGDKIVEQSALEEAKRQQEELAEILKKRKRWRYVYYRVSSL